MKRWRYFWLALWLGSISCGVLARGTAEPTATPSAFVQRYASPEEIAPIATAAAENCGKPYFGTFCGNPPRYVTPTPE